MTVFKLNDKIECINPGSECLTKGKVYTVTGATVYWVLANSDMGNDCWYDPTRFKLYEEKEMQFTKAMLKTGMRVVHGKHSRDDAKICIVVKDLNKIMFADGSWNYLSSYAEDLTMSGGIWDITEVYDCPDSKVLDFTVNSQPLLWKRVDTTEEQKQLDILMKQITDLQTQAEKLQVLINK